MNILCQYLRETERPKASYLPETEARLLEKINEGFPPDWWRRYNELIEKRRAETLTPEEQGALISLSDQIEELNAHRIQYLIELARLRQTSLPELMEQLGIKLPPTGRATVEKLQLNRSGVVNLRRALRAVDKHPPK